MPDQATIFLVRHAHAGNREQFDGDDRYRPLTKRGRAEAVAIAEMIAARLGEATEGVLMSSPFVRCYQTIEPLALSLDREIVTDARLSEGYDRDGALAIISSVAHGSVLCTHGDIIPDVMGALQRRGAEIVGAPDWRKGATWVLTRVGDQVTLASAIPPPDF